MKYEKTCTKCGAIKLLADFYTDKSKPDGKRPDCKLCSMARQTERYERDPEAFKKAGSKHYSKNKSKFSEKHKSWARQNPEKTRQYSAAWRKKNTAVIAMHANKRRAVKLGATPSWLTADQIEHMKDLHEAARQFRIYTGIPYEVDHIVPLQGENVCGLHVPWNMQIIEARQNRSKKNKVPPELGWQGVQ